MAKNSQSSGCSKYFGSAVVVFLLGSIPILWGFYSFYENNRDTKRQLDNQAIQLAYQETQIALANQQYQLQAQQLTLAAQQGQLFTPISSDNGNFSITSTAYFAQATQIEATSQAIATKQKGIEATQTAVAIQSTPSVVIRADDVISQINGVDNGVPNALSWWREYEPSGNNGDFTPSSFTGKKCYGLAWNTNQYGYHRLVVFQKTMSLTFAAGGWYVKVCIPDYVVISAEDIGKIKADWLGKRYGDTKQAPWRVIVEP